MYIRTFVHAIKCITKWEVVAAQRLLLSGTTNTHSFTKIRVVSIKSTQSTIQPQLNYNEKNNFCCKYNIIDRFLVIFSYSDGGMTCARPNNV